MASRAASSASRADVHGDARRSCRAISSICAASSATAAGWPSVSISRIASASSGRPTCAKSSTQWIVIRSRNSSVHGMIFAAMIAETVSAAASMRAKVASIVFFAAGLGTSLSSTFVMMPSVPSRADEDVLHRIAGDVLHALVAEPDDVAVGEHDFHAHHVVARDAVFQPAQAAGVFRDVAADGAKFSSSRDRADRAARRASAASATFCVIAPASTSMREIASRRVRGCDPSARGKGRCSPAPACCRRSGRCPSRARRSARRAPPRSSRAARLPRSSAESTTQVAARAERRGAIEAVGQQILRLDRAPARARARPGGRKRAGSWRPLLNAKARSPQARRGTVTRGAAVPAAELWCSRPGCIGGRDARRTIHSRDGCATFHDYTITYGDSSLDQTPTPSASRQTSPPRPGLRSIRP